MKTVRAPSATLIAAVADDKDNINCPFGDGGLAFQK
jgi:hypothetical protein